MITNPVIIYNNNIAQSLADAQWYQSVRGFPSNLIGVDFDTTTTNNPTRRDLYTSGSGLLTYAAVITSVVINGVTYNDWDGDLILDAITVGLASIPLTFLSIDAVLMSTYTPFKMSSGGNHSLLCVPATIGYFWGIERSLPATQEWPHGRLGLASNSGPDTWDYGTEFVTSGGDRVFRTSVLNALAGEAASNKQKLHALFQTADDAYWTATNVDARNLELVDTYGVQNVIRYQSNSDGWPYAGAGVGGIVSTPNWSNPLQPVFCFLGAASFNSVSNAIGSAFVTNFIAGSVLEASPQPGGWGCCWYSTQKGFASSILYRGGSAAVCVPQEPYSTGIRNPFDLFSYLQGGTRTLAESLALTTQASTAGALSLNGNQTVVGDPLYVPYLTPSGTQSSAPSFF